MARKPNDHTVLAVTHEPKPQPNGQDHAAEKVAVAQDLIVPAALLLAAESVSAHNDDLRPYLCGVHLQARDGKGRISSTDARRAFLSSFPVSGPMPDWMKEGVILSNKQLKAQVGFIARGTEAAQVRLRYAVGLPKIEISDLEKTMTFQALPLTGHFPNLDNLIPAGSIAALDDDGNPIGKEWQPVGINSGYLKHVGELSKMLSDGLIKKARPENGMVIRAFNAGNDPMQPLLFDFVSYPGALLMISPAKLSGKGISAETAALMEPAIRRTLAALRAHETRNLAWAEDTSDPHQKAAFLAKAEGFKLRVADILKSAPGLPAIGTEAAQPEPEQDDSEDENEAQWDDQDRPGDAPADEGEEAFG